MTQPTTRQVGAVLRIPITHVHPGTNARGDLGDITDLAVSIATIGLQEPLIVAELDNGHYEVFEGHRRLAACKRAGLDHIYAVVKTDSDPATRTIRQLAIHSLAKAFDPIAEAKALHDLLYVHMRRPEEVARALGKSPAWISGRLALLNLTDSEASAVSAGRMPLHQAHAIVAERRAERAGRPSPRPARPAPVRVTPRQHCSTCTCHGRTA